MSIYEFLKDKILFISLNLSTAIFSAVLLYMVNADFYFVLFIPCVYVFCLVLSVLTEYIVKNNYYKKIYNSLESLDKKCLLSEIIEKPSFCEGKIMFDILKTTHKSMNDEIAKYSLSSAEYREYIELWVHEIKTPIAGAKLICENLQNEALGYSLERIDKFVQEALFYSRSNNLENDFFIKQVQLKELVSGMLRKNAKNFISNKIVIEMKNLDGTVFTDIKWTDFILEQIFNNSAKYKSSKIIISAKQNENSVSLFISDNGIGISKKDINRVFDKGFTGENGRKFAKSTGMGLYLCKKLCLKMGLNILIKSEKEKGTSLEIVFPKGNMYL